jgi:hypothetical protein
MQAPAVPCWPGRLPGRPAPAAPPRGTPGGRRCPPFRNIPACAEAGTSPSARRRPRDHGQRAGAAEGWRCTPCPASSTSEFGLTTAEYLLEEGVRVLVTRHALATLDARVREARRRGRG